MASRLFARMTGFASRWSRARVKASRIAWVIAADQLEAWSLHPDSRRRSQAVTGWADMLRELSYA